MEQRQIAYYYNGILKAEETDLDLDGDDKHPHRARSARSSGRQTVEGR